MISYLIREDTPDNIPLILNVKDNKVRKHYHNYDKQETILPLTPIREDAIRMLLLKNPIYYLSKPQVSSFFFHQLELAAGNYYPRIYRPLYKPLQLTGLKMPIEAIKSYPIDRKTFYDSITQTEYLFELLKNIFRVIQPEESNFNTYGIEIRNLIILICTEIEAQWKGILKANGYTNEKNRYKMEDYVKLLDILRLSEYSISFRLYPHIIRGPYVGWNTDKPSQSLFWYDNYNKVKHDREASINFANISTAIYAISALIIILYTQYGPRIFQESHLKNHFIMLNQPQWKSTECYLLPGNKDHNNWISQKRKID